MTYYHYPNCYCDAIVNKNTFSQRKCDREAVQELCGLYFCTFHWEKLSTIVLNQKEVERQERYVKQQEIYFKNHWIYYLQNTKNDLIKIGFSSNIERRMQQLKKEGQLVLLAKHNGTMQNETEIHQKFSYYRIRGEWFHPSTKLLEHINNVKKEVPNGTEA